MNQLLITFYPKTQKRECIQAPSAQFLNSTYRQKKLTSKPKTSILKTRNLENNDTLQQNQKFSDYVKYIYQGQVSPNFSIFAADHQEQVQPLGKTSSPQSKMTIGKQDYQYLITAKLQDSRNSQRPRSFFSNNQSNTKFQSGKENICAHNDNQQNSSHENSFSDDEDQSHHNKVQQPSTDAKRHETHGQNHQVDFTFNEKVSLMNQVKRCIEDTSPFHKKIDFSKYIGAYLNANQNKIVQQNATTPQDQGNLVQQNILKQNKIQQNYEIKFKINNKQSPQKMNQKKTGGPTTQQFLPKQLPAINGFITPLDSATPLTTDTPAKGTRSRPFFSQKKQQNDSSFKQKNMGYDKSEQLSFRICHSPLKIQRPQTLKKRMNLRVYSKDINQNTQTFNQDDSVRYYLTKLDKIRYVANSFKKSSHKSGQKFNITCYV